MLLPLAHPWHRGMGAGAVRNSKRMPPTPAPSPTGTTYGPLLSSSAPVLTARRTSPRAWTGGIGLGACQPGPPRPLPQPPKTHHCPQSQAGPG